MRKFKNWNAKVSGHRTFETRKQSFYQCVLNLHDCTFKVNFFLAGNYMFKVNNRNTKARCKICSKLTI